MTEIKVKNWQDSRFTVSEEAILEQAMEENKQQASAIMKDIARYFHQVSFDTLDSKAIAIALLLGKVPHVTINYENKK